MLQLKYDKMDVVNEAEHRTRQMGRNRIAVGSWDGDPRSGEATYHLVQEFLQR